MRPTRVLMAIALVLATGLGACLDVGPAPQPADTTAPKPTDTTAPTVTSGGLRADGAIVIHRRAP